ncbi:uncharacterized protein LOC117756567 [Hippoglossus hippoglossus]|uniref:uncharacterized protein LOC117756567 n=1 Tax=Hippoglossus hippoglossus TaxID=8267 RepID=UPI00148D140E|nr:uncharacterized protein LOC117756567 [Hippoglossus hippoglossus]
MMLTGTILITRVRILPMEMPDHICEFPPESVNVVPGRPILFINMKGRYDLNLPELRCGSCCASWKPELNDVQVSGYWPATIHFYTLYDVAIFQGFKEMKLVAPGNSRLSFMRMLEAQTTECGRTGKVCSDTFYKSFMEWVICSYEVNKLCSEQPFTCPACCPQMLAVSVDGNRKHYRFKKDGCTDEASYFEGVLLCKDDEVAAFVEDIQRRTKHVPGKGVCGRSPLNAAKETSKRSSSSLDEQTQRDLQRERQSLEAIKEDLSVNDETVQQWVIDVQDWAEQDTNSGHSVIRSRMWSERNQLEVHVAQHDEMVQPQQQIGAVENLLKAGYIFPWLLPPSGI